ncbi:MAG: dihydropteroate synthase [Acidocella sp. 20-61-6]|nr:MAG: dihydropteroate synthase [Acidocella sp. 20-61-6]
MAVTPPIWAGLRLDRPRVMGILNVTEDSFSDGGAHASAEAAIAAGLAMHADGADIVDVGGESTRPGAAPVTPEAEAARIAPVIAGLSARGVIVSADTRNAATMQAALDAGARIINDVSGLRHDPDAAALVAGRGCPVVLMHMRGSPLTMGCMAHYAELIGDVLDELTATRDAALIAGIRAEAIALDPGFGFAKRGDQNVSLLRALKRFAALGHTLLIGLSRKKFIGEVSGEPDPRQRLGGSLAAGLYAVTQGAHILRVHDVKETAQALRVWQGLIAGDDGDESQTRD